MNSTLSSKSPQEGTLELSDGTLIHSFVRTILNQRGIKEEKELLSFLEPKLQDLPNPFLMKDMEKAVAVIARALAEKQEIFIWGDYDVDGTTATAVLLLFFQQLGHNASYYIPNRLTEGYGLNKEGLLALSKGKEQKQKVLITVDNGISSFVELKFAKELGFTTIVTDHHLPPEEKVPADAVLNTHQKECDFPSEDLAGVGVAFYLIMGLRAYLVKNNFFTEASTVPNLKSFLDLVAVGTVADMVPLMGINRVLVRAGMEVLAAGSNLGLTALCHHCNVHRQQCRSEDISFQLGPKINAAGRMGNADKAVQLFTSSLKAQAEKLAEELVDTNNRRRSKTLTDINEAESLRLESGQSQDSSLVLAGKFHVGVAGIVAANLTERYDKPTVVLCQQEGGIFKGSARSVSGVNLYQVLQDCRDVLLGFGGHAMAGGMTLAEEKLEAFKNLFEQAVYRQNGGETGQQKMKIDYDMQIDQLFSGDILPQLHLLEPFGVGNPPLIIRDLDADIKQISAVGTDKQHLRFSFGKGGGRVNGVGFGLGGKIKEYRGKGRKEVLFTPTVNFFKGQCNWEARVEEIKVVQHKMIELHVN